MTRTVRSLLLAGLATVALVIACVVRSTSRQPNEAAPAPAANPTPPSQETPPPVTSAAPALPPPASGAISDQPSSPTNAEASAPSSRRTVPPPASSAAATTTTPPQSERECRACNGEWGIHGLAQKPSCNCRTTDGGKRCRDGNDCQGLCVGGEVVEREVVDKGPPARGFFVGRCSKFATVFGCYRPIEDGAGAHPVDLTEPPQMICAD